MALLACGPPADAGTERYGRVVVTVEEDARGTHGQGYCVYPVTIVNRGTAPRTVTVTVPAQSWGGGYRDHLTSVSRTFRVEAGGAVAGELLAPSMSLQGENAAVSIDGRRQDDAVPLSVSSGHAGYGSSGAASVLLSRDLGVAARGVLEEARQRHQDHGGGGYGATRTGAGFTLHNAKPVSEWRGGWLTYTGLAEVVVTERDLTAMTAETRDALRGYVLAGGRLTVVSATRWPAVPGWPVAEPEPATTGVGARAAVGLGELRWWPADELTGLSDRAADGWVDDAVAAGRAGQRRMEADQADKSFPVIDDQRTPVRGLLALMVVFALLIGPVNILVLSLIKRRMWLLWTVPVGSALFSGAVVAYALFSEGITPTARTASVTLLDQTTREAVTKTLRGYYAPLTPGDGLRFNLNTAVSPQIGQDTGYRYDGGGGRRGRAVDTTTDQHLARGWVAARVPAHLQLTTVEKRRERLDFERLDDGGLAVVNGLGVDVRSLRAIDANGDIYLSKTIAPGQRVVLAAASQEEASKAVESDWGGDFPTIPTEPFFAFIHSKSPTYTVTLEASPFVEDGLAGIGNHRTQAVLHGRWREGN